MNSRALSQCSLCHVTQNILAVHLSPPSPSDQAFHPSSLFLLLAFLSLSSAASSGLPLRPRHRRLTLSHLVALRRLPLSPSAEFCPHLFPASSPSPRRGCLPPSFPARRPLCPTHSPPPAPSTFDDPSLRRLSPSPLGPPLHHRLSPLRPLILLSSPPPATHMPTHHHPTPPPWVPNDATPRLLHLTVAPLRNFSPALSPPPLAGTFFPHHQRPSPRLSHPSCRPAFPRSLDLDFSPSHHRSPYPHPATPPPSTVTTKPSRLLLALLRYLPLPKSLSWLTVAEILHQCHFAINGSKV